LQVLADVTAFLTLVTSVVKYLMDVSNVNITDPFT